MTQETSDPIEELVRRNIESQSQIRELYEANLSLSREVAAGTYKMETIMHALVAAAERLGDVPMVQIIRMVTPSPSAVPPNAPPDAPLNAPFMVGATGANDVPAANQILSKHEREVLAMLADGRRSPYIATGLGITVATVEVHRRNIMRKLGLHNIAELTKYAVRQGLSSL
jgi:DNA-binding NarL/FixJ family response regulator